MVELWLKIGTIGMAIGVLLLFFPMQKNRTESEQSDSIMHFFVPLIALSLYWLMTLGYGQMTLGSGRVFYYGRYIDWAFTTPLLLLSLASGAIFNQAKKPYALIAGLLGSDVYMIVTGLVAGFTDNPVLKWSFYGLSCLGFLAIYAILFGPLKAMSETDNPKGSDYRSKASVLALIWFAYPVVFLLGQEGVRFWSAGVDALLFTCLDLSAKVLYGLWAVSMARKTAGKLQYA